MHDLDVTAVTRIAREAARREALPLEVLGAVLGGGDSDYVEILVNFTGCATDPCQLTIGVFRNVSERILTDEIAARLRQHVDAHQAE